MIEFFAGFILGGFMGCLLMCVVMYCGGDE